MQVNREQKLSQAVFNVSYKCTRGAVYEKPAECGLMDGGFTVPSACVRWGNQVQVKQQCRRQGHKQKLEILIFIEGRFLSHSPPPASGATVLMRVWVQV